MMLQFCIIINCLPDLPQCWHWHSLLFKHLAFCPTGGNEWYGKLPATVFEQFVLPTIAAEGTSQARQQPAGNN
jgi:hypothetical protein